MERNAISPHEVRLFQVLRDNPDRWLTGKQLAAEANIAERTARAHAVKLVRLGIADQAELFPSHHYRIAKADKKTQSYLARLQAAAEIFEARQG